MDHEWKDSREEYPTTVGDYLIYGDPFSEEGSCSYTPKFSILRVLQTTKHLTYIAGDHFWYPSSRDRNYFKWRPLNAAPPEM